MENCEHKRYWLDNFGYTHCLDCTKLGVLPTVTQGSLFPELPYFDEAKGWPEGIKK